MRKLLILPVLLLLSGCYDGHVRYSCQEYQNWKKPECNVPKCISESECTKDLFDEEQLKEVEKVLK